MKSTARHQEILRAFARGGLSTQQVDRLEDELHQLEASARREREWMESTTAKIQPRFKIVDAYE